MHLPSAIVVGPQRAGTTWLHEYLAHRGDVCLPALVKETFYFDRYHNRGIKWYAKHFKHKPQHALIMEVAPSYFHCPQAPVRMLKDLGNAKVVCTLRDPVKRTFSLYLLYLRYGTTTKGLREAIVEFPEILQSSYYAEHLSRWIEAFGREQVLVVSNEDMSRDIDSYVMSINEFLGLAHITPGPELQGRINETTLPASSTLAALGLKVTEKLRDWNLHRVVNAAKALGLSQVFYGKPGQRPVPELSVADRKWLEEKLYPQVDALEKLLGRDFSHWKK